MKAAFYAGASGLLAQERALDIIGNNIANVNTNGFQSQAVGFQQLLTNELYANSPTQPRSGYGVRADTAGLRGSGNSLRQTGSMLDFAIVGDGYFAVQNGAATQYTRDGSFGLAMDGTSAHLVTQDGRYVLDRQGARITLTPNADGEFNPNELADKIGVYSFPNPAALQPASGNNYEPTVNSGIATPVDGNAIKLMQRAIEGSGVSMADEMSDMIITQRAYQISARVVQTSDEIEQTVNNLRK